MDKPFVVVVMGQDSAELTLLSICSILSWADKIIYLDGGSKDDTLKRIGELNDERIMVWQRFYDKNDKKGNGKQRNYYLSYLKEHFSDCWCLVLDSDELVDEKGYRLKEFINTLPADSPEVFSVKMRHFIRDLAHEDSTLPEHYVPNRLFKVSEGLNYPEVEHPILTGGKGQGSVNLVTIWHFAYAKEMFSMKKRYEEHLSKSNIHTPDYLRSWYLNHILGTYKTSSVKVEELPELVKEYFRL